MEWVCSPNFYGPLANWPWLKISPQSSFNVICCLIISAWQWLMSFTYIHPVFLCKLTPIKAHWRKGSWPFSFERSATFPPQADRVLVDLFSSMVDGGLCGQSSPQCMFSCHFSPHPQFFLLSSLFKIIEIHACFHLYPRKPSLTYHLFLCFP